MSIWSNENNPTFEAGEPATPEEVFDAQTADEAPEDDSTEGDEFTETGEGEELETPGTEIVTNDEVEIDVSNENVQKQTRFGRAIEVFQDEVTNILRVVVDEDDNVVGYEPEYGTELIVVEDDSPISIGWVRIDGEFIDPNADDE